jgi:AcrR family transcriptional regulator
MRRESSLADEATVAGGRAREPDLSDLTVTKGRRQRKRRRTREDAEREILTAAHKVLDERPFREMTVETIMDRSILARSSFYVYFTDRHEVIVRLIGQIADEIQVFADRWLMGVNGKDDVRAALFGVADLYRRHGTVLRALADAASGDPELEEIHATLIRMLVDATQRGIAREKERGVNVVGNPFHTSRALVHMTESIANDAWGRPGENVETDEIIESLVHIWCWSIYGEPPKLGDSER